MTNHPGRTTATYQSPKPEDIRAFLVERNWTQAKLAEECKVTKRAAEMWLEGTRNMPAGLWELAQIKGLVKL